MSLVRPGEFPGLDDRDETSPLLEGSFPAPAHSDHHEFVMERVRERKLSAASAKLSRLSLRQLQQIIDMKEEDA